MRTVSRASSDKDIVLVIRLGAMGDVLHALPAVASLKLSFPENRILWLVSPKWMPLLEGNPSIDELVPFERDGLGSFLKLSRRLRQLRPEVAIDFQGLLQSAILGRLARARNLFGFARSVAREPVASRLYTHPGHVTGPHRIERNLQLVAAAGASALVTESWIPAGSPEGQLPARPFVLASPFAGWSSKQWPLNLYNQLGRELNKQGLELVINVPPQRVAETLSLTEVHVHTSSLTGLIDATKRAASVVGVDSGPLHLAAALKKPGVALFGPTDPAQTGPFGSPMVVLRDEHAQTTYKRGSTTDQSMANISPQRVAEALATSLESQTAKLAAVNRSS